MKVKELKEELKRINPDADVFILTDVGDTFKLSAIVKTSDMADAKLVNLFCEKTNIVTVRKGIFVQYDVYHPSLNKNWDDNTRKELVESMSDFLAVRLDLDIEEANKISNQVLDEIASLSVEEIKERMNRRECIGAIINRLVGKEIIPTILPPIEEK